MPIEDFEAALEEKAKEFRYQWEKGKVKFTQEVLDWQRTHAVSLGTYLRTSRIMPIVTAPIIYLGVIPFAILDVFLVVFQWICFPVYGVPKVKRSDYIIFDRGHLRYLNIIERLNCIYCSYGNGVFAFATEVAARTEQHWCPIKHAHRVRSPHSRYSHFLEYGDASQYVRRIETVRGDFVDVKKS